MGTGRSGAPHQPRVSNGDDEVEVGFQACLLGWRVLLYLSQGRSKSRPSPNSRRFQKPCTREKNSGLHNFSGHCQGSPQHPLTTSSDIRVSEENDVS